MWQNEPEPIPSTSLSARPHSTKHASVNNLARSSSTTSLFKRAISLQFLTRTADLIVDREKAAFIKMRYKDTAKYVIWPACRLPDKITPPKPVPLAPNPDRNDPRTVLMEADIEDHRSPYMPCTINNVLRSDSEDSSEAEQVLEMTRCSSTETETTT